jgi:CoA-transferase family III
MRLRVCSRGERHNVRMGSFGIAEAVLRHAGKVTDVLQVHTGVVVDANELLTGRAALLGLSPRGRVSAGGATHLMCAADDWCALTLSRPDDVDAVPALLELDAAPDDPWPAIHAWTAERTAEAVLERARLLDLPVAALGETAATPPRVVQCGGRVEPRGPARLLVADLTSMWAGPLCGQLLARAGAVVVKVESPHRPDGTRNGNRPFFDWMNGGKLSYAVDFDAEIDRLRALLWAADVVIEGSRPAALARRGAGPHGGTARPGRVWLRITGHATAGANADRVAFGDDAAVAGGLVNEAADGPVFCADAIADPLTGLEATRAVVASLRRGGGEVIEVSMAAVAATYAALPAGPTPTADATPPSPIAPASDLGGDNAAVERLLTERRLAPC